MSFFVRWKFFSQNRNNLKLRKNEYPDMGFDNREHIGLIAREVEKVFPNLVSTDQNGYQAVSYEKLTVVLLEALKEQQEMIEEQQKHLEELE